MSNEVFDDLDVAEEIAPEVATPEVEEPAKPDTASAEPAKKEPEKAAAPAEPAKPVAAAPEKPTAVDPRHYVPVGVHVELKNEVKQLKEQLAALTNQPKPKPAAPDFTADPKGYVDHTVNAALEQLEATTKPVKEVAERADATASQAQFMQSLAVAEQTFVAQAPDYFEALAHIRTLREAELTTLHPDVPIQQVRQFMAQEELQLAANLMRAGRNPSEVAYTLAKARGYTPKQAKAAAEVAQLVPNVPEPKKLPPDQTLGTGAGSPGAGDEQDEVDPFDAAMSAVFGRKRA